MVHTVLSTLLAAGAGLYIWVFVSQLTTPGFGWLQKGLRRSFLRPLISCPWCFGAWISALLVIFLQWGEWGWVITPTAILASAALVGLMGSFTPGINDEDE